MIDTHCHLTDPRLLQQIEAVLSRAKGVGIDRMITVGTNLADARDAISLCERHSNLRCAIGIHPNYCHEAEAGDVEILRQLQSHHSVVALGEMGLDYFHKFADRATQKRFFERQLALATELHRPVVIHSRDATDDTLAMMKGFSAGRAVFHCFTGTPAEAEKILAAGHLISFTGAVTFKKSDGVREAARITPHDRLMVETDAPYLTPEPHRSQKINEPALVVHVAATIAKVWDVSAEEFDKITTANAERFFSLS